MVWNQRSTHDVVTAPFIKIVDTLLESIFCVLTDIFYVCCGGIALTKS